MNLINLVKEWFSWLKLTLNIIGWILGIGCLAAMVISLFLAFPLYIAIFLTIFLILGLNELCKLMDEEEE